MRLLPDTNAFLMFLNGDPRFSNRAKEALLDTANEIQVSVVVAWEIQIKYANGGLGLPHAPEPFCEAGRVKLGAIWLSVLPEHVARLGQLRSIHRDPFDRMLVAQALVEGLTIVTRDRLLGQYGVPVLW